MSSSRPDVQMVVKAADFAAQRHRSQRRKGPSSDPYINHPLRVARILSDAGVSDAEVLSAAMLHDTVEDTGTSPAEIVREFGDRVARIVAEATDDKSLSKVERKRRQISHAREISDQGKLVKLADKIANVRDLMAESPWDADVTQGYAVWAREVCQGLKGVNADLDRQAAELWKGQVTTKGGQKVPAIPPGSSPDLLERYYRLIENQ